MRALLGADVQYFSYSFDNSPAAISWVNWFHNVSYNPQTAGRAYLMRVILFQTSRTLQLLGISYIILDTDLFLRRGVVHYCRDDLDAPAESHRIAKRR